MKNILLLLALSFAFASCNGPEKKSPQPIKKFSSMLSDGRAGIYTTVKLTTDTTLLTNEERSVIRRMIEAAKIMDEIFWIEAFGEKNSLLDSISDPKAKTFAAINYGPWDRLDENKPFIAGFDKKPLGAGFYPPDITAKEWEEWSDPVGKSPYSMVRRAANGNLTAQWYHDFFAEKIQRAVALIREAASITTDPELKYYLTERAIALETDQYYPSDIAWLGMKNNHLDLIIGPIENYEDKLAGIKTSHEAYVLVKDMEWSKKLSHYAALLPQLQKNLPCEAAYKKDAVGNDSQLAAFDIVYYAGDCNSGSKTIAVNLPNEESIQQQYGTRRSQLKNAMRAKYDKILVPIAQLLIAEEQQPHISFNAFFSNVMFHEVAHGLGIKNTVSGKGTVREALKEQHSALEEEKADVLGLWLVTRLFEMGEFSEGQVLDNYVTFLAGIFRSCRFGASSAHGKANMHTFHFLQENGAFSKNPSTGKYRVDFEKMKIAVNALAAEIIKNQGDGDYDRVKEIMATKGTLTPDLENDLKKANESGIPVDVVFEQGLETLGL
ncbi:MAG: Zn-dependent hydrolase [Crocinitomicaceae bacterium]|nr:Zn-dependent hydrolase [Crocinitomicaceae bacterium]